MKYIKLLLLSAIVPLVVVAHAQTSPVPKNYVLEKETDYKKYNKDVVNCVNWLEKKHVASDSVERREVFMFLIKWISGSPDVTIELEEKVVPHMDDNPELPLDFMGGWARYAIEHPGETSKVKGCVAGLQSVIKVYKANTNLQRDTKIKKLIALDDKGELENWVKEQLK